MSIRLESSGDSETGLNGDGGWCCLKSRGSFLQDPFVTFIRRIPIYSIGFKDRESLDGIFSDIAVNFPPRKHLGPRGKAELLSRPIVPNVPKEGFVHCLPGGRLTQGTYVLEYVCAIMTSTVQKGSKPGVPWISKGILERTI